MIRGNVADDGTITSGTGFTATRLGVGRYQITFTTAFTVEPTTIVTKIYGSPSVDAGTGVEPAENAIVDLSSTTTAIIATSNANGNLADGSFGFVTVGDLP